MQPTFTLCLNGIELTRSKSFSGLVRVARILVREHHGVCAEIHEPAPPGGTMTIKHHFTTGTLGWEGRVKDRPLGVGEADELAVAVMQGRADLPPMSLDEWVVEHRAWLTKAERLAAEAVRDAHPDHHAQDECA